MGSCVSKKSRPSSTLKKSKKPSAPKSRKRPSRLVQCASTFEYIPVADLTSHTVDTSMLKPVYQVDFDKIYRKSEIIDKRLFLNSGFIASDVLSPPALSPFLLSPITPSDNFLKREYIAATFTSEPSPFPLSPSPRTSGPNPSPFSPQLRGTIGSYDTIRTARTTFISEDATGGVFSFDEETIREMSKCCSSSVQCREVIAIL